MPMRRLQDFLDRNGVEYATITRSPACTTAQEIAASAHIPGRELAKTVMVNLDAKMAMAVLPASHQLDLDRIAEATGAHKASIASEEEFRQLFAESEPGARPPFGNLDDDMPVYVAEKLAREDDIVFNAGSHIERSRGRAAGRSCRALDRRMRSVAGCAEAGIKGTTRRTEGRAITRGDEMPAPEARLACKQEASPSAITGRK